jgi:hypothetical protein
VIASEAKEKIKKRLDTGTISFSDIESKAEFNVSHIAVSGGIGGAGAPAAYQNSEKYSSITHSAVEQGQLIIRTKDKQQQDINVLSQDTENANHTLKPIFDKQKELDKIETVELIKDIAQQTKSIMGKYDRIQAQKDVDKDKEKLSRAEAEKAYKELSDKERAQIDFEKYYENNKDYWYYVAVDTQLQANQATKNLGTMGGDVSKGIDSAASIITGIIAGDITGGLAGASAPWLAEQIKIHAGDNEVARLTAHAILGAVVAELQGNSALAGGLGAAASERSAEVITGILYPNKAVTELSQEERQKISALSQLATGLAIAASGGDIQDVNTGIAASKNAVENNFAAVVVRAGGMICVRISVCANYVAGTGLAALLGISVVNSLSENDKTNAINAIRSGDSFAIASLTEEQIDFLNKNKNDFLIADFADRIPLIHGQESNSSTSQNNGIDGSSDSNNIAGSGSVVAGGAPGLPPDDDDDKKQDNSKLNSDPKDRIQHENYKDDLRAKMEKPNVKDPELKNIMDDLYRPNAKIGSGSTADAVRYETATGQNVGGKLHLEKAKNYVKALESWLKRNPTAASADRAAAENVMKDLKNAIRGK